MKRHFSGGFSFIDSPCSLKVVKKKKKLSLEVKKRHRRGNKKKRQERIEDKMNSPKPSFPLGRKEKPHGDDGLLGMKKLLVMVFRWEEEKKLDMEKRKIFQGLSISRDTQKKGNTGEQKEEREERE